MHTYLQRWGDILLSMRSWRLHDTKTAGYCPVKNHLFTQKLQKKKNFSDWIVNTESNFCDFFVEIWLK